VAEVPVPMRGRQRMPYQGSALLDSSIATQ